MLKIQFPQINRKLTAGLWLLLVLLVITINLLHNRFFDLTPEKKLRLKVMQNPTISSLHEKLGQYYLEINEKTAEKEYKIAQEYFHPQQAYKGTNVLGDQSPPAQAGNPWQTWTNLISQKKNLENELTYWEKIKEAYPDYIYAYLKLAVLHTKKGEVDKAKVYLTTVLQSDPNDQIVLKLWQKLQ